MKCCSECCHDRAAFEKLKREAEAEDAKKAALWEEVNSLQCAVPEWRSR